MSDDTMQRPQKVWDQGWQTMSFIYSISLEMTNFRKRYKTNLARPLWMIGRKGRRRPRGSRSSADESLTKSGEWILHQEEKGRIISLFLIKGSPSSYTPKPAAAFFYYYYVLLPRSRVIIAGARPKRRESREGQEWLTLWPLYRTTMMVVGGILFEVCLANCRDSGDTTSWNSFCSGDSVSCFLLFHILEILSTILEILCPILEILSTIWNYCQLFWKYCVLFWRYCVLFWRYCLLLWSYLVPFLRDSLL